MKRDITLENFLNRFDLKTKLNITCIQFNTGDINIYISVIMYLIVLLFFISFLSIYTSFFCECWCRNSTWWGQPWNTGLPICEVDDSK